MKACLEKVKIWLKKTSSTSGFTITEMLIVLFIMGILAGATLPSFNTFNRRQKIKQGTKKLKTDIRTVQNRSLTGYNYSNPLAADDKPDAWGIRIVQNSDTYEMFSCQSSDDPGDYSYSGGSCTNQSVTSLSFPTGVQITTITPAAPMSIIFDIITGAVYFKNDTGSLPYYSGPVVVRVNWPGWSSSEERQVRITSGGNIEDVKQ